MIVGDSWVADVLVVGASLLGLLYYYLTANNDYWKNLGVPYLKPTLLYGNLKDQFLMRKPALIVLDDIYKSFKGERFGGYFEARTPVLMIRDPQLIERILIKDFSNFQTRDGGNSNVDTQKEPLFLNLFSLNGWLWKNLRNKLTPNFTTGKLRGMLGQFCNCADELLNMIERNTTSSDVVDAKLLGSTFTTDVIASVTFGVQFKPDSPEGVRFREVTKPLFNISPSRLLRSFFLVYFRSLANLIGLRLLPKDVDDYMVNLVKTTIDFRKKNGIRRNDFLQLMMDLKDQEQSGKPMNWKSELHEEDAYLNHIYSVKDGKHPNSNQVITDECIAAQAFVFITGGSEATANSVQFSLYELGVNPHIQTRLQQEVDTVLQKYGGEITYEGLKEMTYLDLFIQERNRKYTEGQFLVRTCESPYLIPDTDIVLPKAIKVLIPVYSIHHDPAYYPEPDEFIPERFEGNNHRPSATYLPFGDGPRVCIGVQTPDISNAPVQTEVKIGVLFAGKAMRFVILELKTCLAKILSQYTVTIDPRTQVPLEFDPKSLLLKPKGGIWVGFKKREKNYEGSST